MGKNRGGTVRGGTARGRPPSTIPTIVLTAAEDSAGGGEGALALRAPISEFEGLNLSETVSETDTTGTHRRPSEKRETWGSHISYILALVGYAVGFGNVWRFPYQVRENGGFVFLIPYLTMLAIMGIPTFFLELAVGQRRRKGIIYVWKEISPAFGGLGLCCGCLCFLIGLYYNTLIAYCIGYLINSFRSPLPWSDCNRASDGNTDHQIECEAQFHSKESKYYWWRGTLDASTDIDTPGNYSPHLVGYHIIAWTIIWLTMCSGNKAIEKVTYFTTLFPYGVLLAFFIANCVIQPGKGWLGAVRLLKPNWSYLWYPVTWLKAGSQIFFSLGLGVGCLVQFASYSPARNNCRKDAILISLINCGTSIFAAMVVFPMIGALGYRNYETCLDNMTQIFPNMSAIAKHDDHYDIYFTTKATHWDNISLATPVHIRYGYGEMTDEEKNDLSFPRFEEIIQNITDPREVNRPNRSISFQAAIRDCSIGKEATASGEGTGFVFVGFTEAVMHIPGTNFWSVLFFFMLIMLGLDSGFGVVIGSVTAFMDLTNLNRFISTTIVCGVMMSLALMIFPFGYGIYILDLLDQFTVNWTLLFLASMECIAVSWGYGLAQIAYDVKLMTGKTPNLYFLLCWKYITPVTIIFLLTTTVVQFIVDTNKNGGIYYNTFKPSNSPNDSGEVSLKRPGHTIAIAFILMFLCIMWLPINAVLRKTKYELLKDKDLGDFPEEELRTERHIAVAREEDQFTPREKSIMGRRSLLSLQEHRDQTVKESGTSLQSHTMGVHGASASGSGNPSGHSIK